MTQDEIIEMAREAKAAVGKPTPTAPDIIFTQCLDIILFAKLVAAKEREACAKLCDARAIEYDGFTEEQNASEKLATAIRARGES